MNQTRISTEILGDGISQLFSFRPPTSCPSCNVSLDPKFVFCSHYCSENRSPGCFAVMYFCTSCKHFFISEYSFHDFSTGSNSVIDAFFNRSFPLTVVPKDFSEDIIDLSPSFVDIYNQSYAAEQYGLTEICGMGYRKALEFLVKDFLIQTNPEAEDTIKSLMLGKCIHDYIDNPGIKTLATASAWIGNDETHYVQKNDDYGIEHLKEFITAMISLIQIHISIDKASRLINK